MITKVFRGKNVQEAVLSACAFFKVSEKELSFTVKEEGSKGFLGFGSKEAEIEAYVLEPEHTKVKAPSSLVEETLKEGLEEAEGLDEKNLLEEEMADKNAEDLGLSFLSGIFKAMHVHPTVEVSDEEGVLSFHLRGEDVAILIGRHGDTLYALEFLLSTAINRNLPKGVHRSVVLDVEDYQRRRQETLEALAHRMADKARERNRPQRLEAMRARERRFIHLALEGKEGISSYSEGKEPYRRVVIVPERN